MSSKRSFKLQEFVAHSANANCLTIGRKSGQVIATGGDDKMVNLWRVGKPSCILSLSGHQSPIESLRFDKLEEVVVAGSQGGSIKCFDLQEGKVSRTLKGHMSSCTSVDFHPFGEFVASGSLDTNLKIWDMRSKSCIQTYKGHRKEVTLAKFSPDGKWVASAGKDGVIKLWDLIAGKQLATLDSQPSNGVITAFEFSPEEFLMASAGSDRCVKFWDLEMLDKQPVNPIATTMSDTSPVKSMTFGPGGSQILAATQDNLKCWSWEPAINCHDSLDVGWGAVEDTFITSEQQLVAGCISQAFVSVWIVEMSKVRPFGDYQEKPTTAGPRPSSRPVTGPRAAQDNSSAQMQQGHIQYGQSAQMHQGQGQYGQSVQMHQGQGQYGQNAQMHQGQGQYGQNTQMQQGQYGSAFGQQQLPVRTAYGSSSGGAGPQGYQGVSSAMPYLSGAQGAGQDIHGYNQQVPVASHDRIIGQTHQRQTQAQDTSFTAQPVHAQQPHGSSLPTSSLHYAHAPQQQPSDRDVAKERVRTAIDQAKINTGRGYSAGDPSPEIFSNAQDSGFSPASAAVWQTPESTKVKVHERQSPQFATPPPSQGPESQRVLTARSATPPSVDSAPPTATTISKPDLSASGFHRSAGTGMNDTLEKMSQLSLQSMTDPPAGVVPSSSRSSTSSARSKSIGKAELTPPSSARHELAPASQQTPSQPISARQQLTDDSQLSSQQLFQSPILQNPSQPPEALITEEEVITNLRGGAAVFTTALVTRLQHLHVVRDIWADGNVRGAIQFIHQLPHPQRQAISLEFLRAADFRTKGFNLEGCTELLPLVAELMSSECEAYVRQSVDSAIFLLNMFGHVIANTRQARGSLSRGVVDFSLEDRLRRCDACFDAFQQVHRAVAHLSDSSNASFPSVQTTLPRLQSMLTDLSRS